MSMKKSNESFQPKSQVKELVKPIDIESEKALFEVEALCEEYGAGRRCGVNSNVSDEDDLLF